MNRASKRTSLRSGNVLLSALPFLRRMDANILLVVLLGASFLIFISSIVRPSLWNGFRAMISDVSAPVIDGISKPVINLLEILENFSDLGALHAENKQLKEENERLKEWYQTALFLEAENKSLQELLNTKAETNYQTITARVLVDPQSAFVKSMLINVGEKDGIEKGQPVISQSGLVGRVVDVGQNTARVLKITDINSRVPILIEDTRQHAIMAGYNQSEMMLTHLREETEIRDGARVITSGYGGVFPYGLPIGEIQKSDDAANIITVKPLAVFNKITRVKVLKKKQAPSALTLPTLEIN